MATLYITEFTRTGQDSNGNKQSAVQLPPIAQQTVTITGASAASAATNDSTAIVRLVADTNCHIAVNGTATVSDLRMTADVQEYFYVPAGSTINVIQG